ncbi:hypothetical protein AB0M23_04185 [Streptomyces sp. NPDC052077]|uniref:hypothetical protein n=1 Tax=Streptomyces sp. NPDC052077 TaxID=3154757 RepID=UPI00341586B7
MGVAEVRRPTPAERAAARQAARADREAIVRRYRAREPVRRIAAGYGVTDAWLTRRLRDWGVTPRRGYEAHAHRRSAGRVFRGRPLTRRTAAEVRAARDLFIAARDEAVRRYRSGEVSAAGLGREFGVHPAWVGRRLAEWGAREARPRPRPR